MQLLGLTITEIHKLYQSKTISVGDYIKAVYQAMQKDFASNF
ncbi:hypothetical protein [Spiroplasma clarkii]|nr:hypothetical protein [Spiroplasma clarkii]